MKKFYRFVCVIAMLTILCCCFAGCVVNPSNETENGDETEHGCTCSYADIVQPSVSASKDEDEPVIGSTDTIVTNYSGCWIVLPNGKVIRGSVVSWMVVNENLIQVTLKNMTVVGTGNSWGDGAETYLVSPDRVYFYTD